MAAKKRKTKNGISAGQIALIAGGVGVVAGGGYYGYQYVQNKNLSKGEGNWAAPREDPLKASLPTGGTRSPGQTAQTLPEPPVMLAFPLKAGDKNIYVQRMQQALIRLGGAAAGYINNSGGADGVFGEGTRQALFAAGFENQYANYFTGTDVTLQEYNKILTKAGNSGLSGVASPEMAKVVVSLVQTYLISRDTLSGEDPRAYPVKPNVILGTLVGEKDGLSQILGDDGQTYYTSSSSIKVA